MFFNFKNNNLDFDKFYNVYPYHTDKTFIKLLNLLSDEDIFLTFDEKDYLYKKINDIIKFLEDKKK